MLTPKLKDRLVPVLIFMTGLLAGLYSPVFALVDWKFLYLPGDFHDGRFNNYLLEHVWKFCTGIDKEFWSAPFMYPETEVISYSDNLLGASPFYMVFRMFGVDRETSFQCWFILLSALNYTSAFFFFRFLTRNNMAAACGAFLFAFSLTLHSQLGHAQTLPRYAIPLAFWMLLKYNRTLSPLHFSAMMLLLVYQFYCGIYLGFLTTVPLFVLVVTGFFVMKGKYILKIRDRRWWMLMIAGSALALACLLPLMLPYLERARQSGLHPYDTVSQSLPTLLSYLTSRPGTLFWNMNLELTTSYPAFWDHQLFCGAIGVLSVVLIFVLFMWQLLTKKRISWLQAEESHRLFFLCGLITLFLFLKVGGHSLYYFLYHLPGFGSMRALQRIVNIELLFFGAALAMLFAAIFRAGGRYSGVLFVIVIVLLVLDNYAEPSSMHRMPKKDIQERVTALAAKIDLRDPQTILCYEPEQIENSVNDYQLDAMMTSQSLNIRTMNGYTSTSPAGYSAYWISPNADSRKAWLETKQVGEEQLQVVH